MKTEKENIERTIEMGIEGMECPACATKIEKTISKINGVESVQVNLGSDTATISFKDLNFDVDLIKSEVGRIGYKAVEAEADTEGEEAELVKKQVIKRMRNKIYVSIFLSVIIVILGMKDHLGVLTSLSAAAANWISLPLSTVVVFWCGSKFLRGFWTALQNRTADMDTLITVGTISAYLYSVVILLFPQIAGEHSHTVYFESAAMIITFILIGNYLEANLKERTQYAIKSLTSLQAKNATVLKSGVEYRIPIKKVCVNDIVIVKPGERIPVDGTVTEGSSSVDESMVSGESLPSDKVAGKTVFGGTMNLNGYLKIRTDKVGKDSFLSMIISLVKDAQKAKPKIQRLGDKVSAVFVPLVLVIAAVTFAVWNFWIGQEFAYSLLKGVAVLIIACPCALGLATPIAVVLGVGRAAENRILFNNAEAIENINKINTIAFDKTGTLTYGKFEVTDIIPLNGGKGHNRDMILKIAASIENYSEHPIARAIVAHYRNVNGANGNPELLKVDEFISISGIGVEARVGKVHYKIGGANMLSDKNTPEAPLVNETDRSKGYKNIYLFENSVPVGEIVVSDKIKHNARGVLQKLREEGYGLSLISGDSRDETEKIAGKLGIEDFHSQVLPDRKQEIISDMQKKNKVVAMVGDGINDAPSLSSADLGVAIGTGQDIAIQSADVILVKGELENLLAMFKISRKTIRIIKQNLFWAFFYNAAAIPLAAGVFVPWGISVSPVVASMFMAFSDVVTVLGNSLRLKYVKLD